jgi:hypothetical protein
MQRSHFTSYFPVAVAAGVHWVEWYEVLLANASLLVRCVPTASHSLPDQATTVLLDFGRVIALRGSADPFNLEDPDIQEVLPRETDGRLTSLFNWSTQSQWTKEATQWYPEGIRHFVLCDTNDRAIGILTRGSEPQVILEKSASLPSPRPTGFRSHGPSDA